MLSIDPVAGDPHPVLQLDISNGWDAVDDLISALTAARPHRRSTGQ